MDFIRISQSQDPFGRSSQQNLSTNYEEPIFEFRKQGDFHCVLIIKDRFNSKTICEIFFMERDIHDFIMKAEMVSRFDS